MNEHAISSQRGAPGISKTREPHGAPLAGARILVVAEDEDTRELLGIVLSQAGGVALLAADMPSALGLLEEFLPNVIVCDLPRDLDWSARFLAAARTTTRAEIPAVAISADAAELAAQSALRAGFESFSVKPLGNSELVAAVAAVFERSESRPADRALARQ